MLPLMHKPQRVIVKYDIDNRQAVTRHRRQFVHVHPEASVAGHVDDLLARIGKRRTDCGRQSVPHRTESAGGQKTMRLGDTIIARHPHLMLAYICRKNRITGRNPVNQHREIRPAERVAGSRFEQ